MQAGIGFESRLRALVVEASLALARLDADRLEELALCCQALNRDLAGQDTGERVELARQAREASGELSVFGRVLEATRANLEIVKRLGEGRRGRLEYGARSGSRAGQPWAWAEKSDGHN